MKKAYFITGTDTGIGKTWATVALMRYFKQQGHAVIGMKPVAAGCERVQGQLKNEDALLLQQNASVQLEYDEINPYAFEMPVSPHLASQGEQVEFDCILQSFTKLKDKADVLLVEGAGGWFAPLNNDSDIADLAKALKIPVIMVVGIRLGCINHARLSFVAMQASGVSCAGWIAMCLDQNMAMRDENIETIKKQTSAPLLGVLPYTPEMDFNSLSSKINGEILI